MCRVAMVLAAICVAEVFDYSSRSFRKNQLDLLHGSVASGPPDVWDLRPVSESETFPGLMLTFEERRNEYEAPGYLCIEVHRGYEQEMFGSGIVPFTTSENREVIAVRYKRRQEPTD